MEIKGMINYLKRVLDRRFSSKQSYVLKVNDSFPWIFISYIPYVFYLKDKTKLNIHQNQQEMLKMVSVFSEMGFNVFVMDYLSKKSLPDIDVKIIFGLEPLFKKASLKWPNAKSVYYCTGSFYVHQTKMVKKLTDEFNSRFHSNIPYRRTLEPYEDLYIADNILLIGGKQTVDTFPITLKNKIYTIHQSTQVGRTIERIGYAEENEFIFMGSGGNCLKGVGFLIDYFIQHTQYKLHILGPIEDDVMKACKERLTSNICFHGFMNVNSDAFFDILHKCNFLIYPSGSEGCPGAVLNLMKNGMIPIVSPWAAFDEINDYGYMMEDISSESLDNALVWAKGLSKDRILTMKKNCQLFINETYNLDKFAKELKSIFEKII